MKARQISGHRIVAIAVTALFALAAASEANAQPANKRNETLKSSAGKMLAQATPRSRRTRARTRIRVTPVYPYRTESLPYPPPNPYEYPGPNAVRQCSAQLVQEFRPSGTVIVPRTSCWWERY
jgi:hypothetical protein